MSKPRIGTADRVHWKFKRTATTPPIALCRATRKDVHAEGSIILKPVLKSVIGCGYGSAHEETFRECAACQTIGEEALA
jgi:hypothetical protein